MDAVPALLGARPARPAGWLAGAAGALTVVVLLVGAGLDARGPGGMDVLASTWLKALAGTLGFALPGAHLAARRPANAVGWLCLAVGGTYGLTYFAGEYAAYGDRTDALPGALWLRWLGLWAWSVPYVLAPTLLLMLVPTGRLPSARWRPVAWIAAAGVAVVAAAWALTPYEARDAAVDMPELVNPVAVSWGPRLFGPGAALLVIGVVGGVASLVVRYRRSRGAEREQVAWVLLGALATVALLVTARLLPFDGAGQFVGAAALVPLPLCIAVAVLRHGMWDVNAALSRSLTYAGLAVAVAAVYVVVVSLLGGLVGRTTNAPVAAVAIVAAVASPLRDRLRRGANRVVYGIRDEPWALMARLTTTLQASGGERSAVLRGITETIAGALRVPFVAIETDGEAVGAGRPTDVVVRKPLVHRGVEVGHLVVGDPRGALGTTEHRLLDELAPHLAVSVQALRLTDDIQHARERIVLAREEERRRLRRDLHDGVGPSLAAVALGLESSRELLDRSPAEAGALLTRLARHLNDTVGDVRHLIDDLRPADLDDLGLLAAIENQLHRFRDSGRAVELAVSGSLIDLPAAVEVALLRITSEAVSNAARHAHATCIDIHIERRDGEVALSISDDGTGFVGDPTRRGGVGMTSMRERAEELGGTFEATSSDRGTTVGVHLPVAPP